MLASFDVRRTSGGLQLTMIAPGASQPWATRLRYDQAQELSAGLRTDAPALVGGTAAAGIAYFPDCPETGEGTLARVDGETADVLRDSAYLVRADLKTMRGLGDTLRAHMPDRLDPLPAGPPAPWWPSPLA
ncbi:hypothetical protein [Amycolatopsis sp. NPDC004079]|uniref:hypothetical protein n=1 Tax=Amycolatopsis sp. NPDC004079 TaxID=3154549 RepID=UPI0033A1F8CC